MFVGNPYQILGVQDGASEEECKKAYRKLCREHHPDNGGNAELYDRVNKAYEATKSGKFIRKVKRRKLTHGDGLFSYSVI